MTAGIRCESVWPSPFTPPIACQLDDGHPGVHQCFEVSWIEAR